MRCWMGRWVSVVHDTRLHLLAFWHGVVSRLLTEFEFLSEGQCYAFLLLCRPLLFTSVATSC